MRMDKKRYVLYLELNKKFRIFVAATNDESVAEAVYAEYINQARRGLVKYEKGKYSGYISQIILSDKRERIDFIYSLEKGFKEIYKKKKKIVA